MPACVVKLCKNNTSRNKKDIGITYHKFPSDPVNRDRWTAVVRLSRQESWWKPGKCSVICSAHFNESDMYFTTGFLKRVYKEAVPQNALFLSSILPDNIFNNSTVTAEPSLSAPVVNSNNGVVTAEPSTSAPVMEGTILTTGKESLTPHEGYRCSECNQCNLNIYGFHYTCLQCDYDICDLCEARGAHPLHYVLRVPGQRPHSETARVFEQVRGVLRAEQLAEEPAQEVPRHTTVDQPPEPEIIKLEVKEEIEDVLDPLRLDASVPESQWRVPGEPADQTTLQLDTVKMETTTDDQVELVFQISPFTPTAPIAPTASSAPIAPSAPPGGRRKRAAKRPPTDDKSSSTVLTDSAVQDNKSQVTMPLRNTQKKGRIFLPPGWPWH